MGERQARNAETSASSVWLRPQRAERDEPPLTRARIVDAAVGILDDGGLDGLSMRRLAEQLGVMAPSLYWHVKTKDDVVDLAVDHVFASVGTLSSATIGTWQQRIETLATGWRAALVRHPWIAPVAARRPSLGPYYLDQLEAIQAVLHHAGLDGPDLSAATWTLYNQIFGSASTQSTLTINESDRELGHALLEERSDRYPTLVAQRYLYNDDWTGDFVRGLHYLLNGIDLHIRSRS